MKLCIYHYQSYYNSVNKGLKIDHAYEIIEEVARSIEINMKYLCHYHFINITQFDFLSDSIVEVAKCGLKSDNVTVSTNMDIDTSSLTQIQISQIQARKNNKFLLNYYLAIMVKSILSLCYYLYLTSQNNGILY